MLRSLFTLALLATPLSASEPPAALLPIDPPAAVVEQSATMLDACVRVSHRQWAASGTCFATDGGKSFVITNNHLFSERNHPDGGFYDDVYPLAATVTHGKNTHKAEAVAGQRSSDLALVVVDGVLPVAPLAEGVPPKGAEVTRNGLGSGLQKPSVLLPDPKWSPEDERMQFRVTGISVSGDSGSAYFDADGCVCAVHCGNADGFARGTPVTAVRVFVREKGGPLFPRLFGRGAKSVPPMKAPEPPPAKLDPKPAPPVPAPKTTEAPKTITLPAAPATSACANGQCPTVSAPTRRGLFRR